MRYFLQIILLLTIFSNVVLAESFSPWTAWRQAYTDFQKGEQARNRGDYADAETAFKESLANYNRVRKARPDWNQNVIKTRIEMCEREIEAVNKLLGKDVSSSTSSAPESRVSDTNYDSTGSSYSNYSSSSNTALQEARDSAEEYKKRLFGVLVELEDLRKQAANATVVSKELENLLSERRILQEKYQLLESRYQNIERKLASPSDELRSSRQQLVETRINLETANKKLQLAEDKNSSVELEYQQLNKLYTQANTELSQLKKQQEQDQKLLAELNKFKEENIKDRNILLLKNDTLTQNIERASTTIVARQKEIDTLNRRLQESSSKNSQGNSLNAEITAENQKLREEINKQTQAQEKEIQAKTQLQNLLRKQTLELKSLQKTLQNIDDRRLVAEQNEKLLNQQIEKHLATIDLNTSELKNLQQLKIQLENDVKSWVVKYEDSVRRLKERDAASMASISTLNSERSKLSTELASSKVAAKEYLVQISQLQKIRTTNEQAIKDLRQELMVLKAGQLSAQSDQKELKALRLEMDKLEQEHAKLNINFNATLEDLKRLQSTQVQLADLKARLAQANTTASQSDDLRQQITELQKQNQILQDNKAALILKNSRESEIWSRQNSDIQKRLNAENSKSEVIQKELNSAKSEVAKLTGELSNLQIKITQQSSDNNTTTANELYVQELEKNKKQIATLLKDISEYNSSQAQTQKELNTLREENMKLRQALIEKKLANNDNVSDAIPELPPLLLPAEAPVDQSGIDKLLASATDAEKSGDKEVAIWNYNAILESRLEHFQANLGLGKLLLIEEKYDAAYTLLQRANLQSSTDMESAIPYAQALIGLKKYGNALAVLAKAKRTTADNYLYRLTYGQAAIGSGDMGSAETSLRVAQKLEPKESQPYIELAQLLCMGGKSNYEEAAKLYEQAKKLGATPIPALDSLLGDMMDKQSELIDFLSQTALEAEINGDTASAIWYYKELVSKEPKKEEFNLKLALNEFKEGNNSKALTILNRYPKSPKAALIHAFILVKLKDLNGAQTQALRGYKLNKAKAVKFTPEEKWIKELWAEMPQDNYKNLIERTFVVMP